uniref:Serpin domain-containing protein n=1 Tax=Cairina moschata TaxID=8855 RepID=A0A8C3CLV9_CAIMO
MGSISAASTEFCFDVFRELKVHHANENICYSPLSIISALAMVYLGARGNTESQMEKVLHFDNMTGMRGTTDSQCGPSEHIHDSFKDLLSGIAMPNATYVLKIADRLYLEKTYPVLPEYLNCAKKFYKAGLEEVDFKTATEEARQLINSWVDKETNGRIQDFLVPSSVDLNTVLVLVNAIYFKGTWKRAFKEEDTQEMPFSMTKQDSKPVQMMIQNSTFKVATVAAEKMKILELPYTSGELSMLVLLPDEVSGLEQQFWFFFFNIYLFLRKISIPTDKVELKHSNLSGISSAESLKMSEAVHGAYMVVNEEGTEVAGSTGVMGDIKTSPEFEEFRADHPFLFLIKHDPTNTILFFGRYCSP